ncbi:hypothetical protein [Streptomyces sp. NPDC005799]|uniref:WD40/YVTN/BNR-like repeat-containing protein n=1 Tax=Streptomyces sp. NPDC005799 TaxID=3154678 RepID=UPI0033FF3CA5
MASPTRSSGKSQPGTGQDSKAQTKSEKRRAAATQRAAEQRRVEVRRRRARIAGAAVVALALAGGGVFLATRGGDSAGPSNASAVSEPVVGGDLHTVTVVGDRLFVGGHAEAAVSRNDGRTWRQVPSLEGADPMGWAVTPDAVLVGGHPGVYRSTDGGATFAKVTGKSAVDDAHALGGSGKTLYLGSPQAGLLASTDGGNSWQVRNAQAGRTFMGTILVDPAKPDRLIAPDMSSGLMTSSDGGRSWKPLGGPSGAMVAAWDPKDTKRIVAVGMGGAELSTDGGATWKRTEVPQGASALAYDARGRTLYAGVLDGRQARVYRSTNGGATWKATA